MHLLYTSGAIPPDTHVQSSLEMNPELQSGELVLSTNNDTVIKAVIMFAEQIFEEESRFMHLRVREVGGSGGVHIIHTRSNFNYNSGGLKMDRTSTFIHILTHPFFFMVIMTE